MKLSERMLRLGWSVSKLNSGNGYAAIDRRASQAFVYRNGWNFPDEMMQLIEKEERELGYKPEKGGNK